MKDEAQLKEAIAAGKDADQWLNHPTYKHVLTLIKAELLGAFEQTKFKDVDDREEIWRKLQSINSITQRMERIVRDGAQAERTLLQKIRDKFGSQD